MKFKILGERLHETLVSPPSPVNVLSTRRKYVRIAFENKVSRRIEGEEGTSPVLTGDIKRIRLCSDYSEIMTHKAKIKIS